MEKHNILRGLLLLIVAVSLQSTTAQDKLFQTALNQTRMRGQFYVARNEKGKGISVEKMRQYAAQHNYIIGKYTEQTIDKFGDRSSAVNTFEFLPIESYPEFVYEKLKDGLAPEYAGITQSSQGSCYIYCDKEFVRMDKVYWTGEVVDGMLSGSGYGFKEEIVDTGSGKIFFLHGAFQNGLPKGDCVFRDCVFNLNNGDPKDVKESGSRNIFVGNLCDGMASYREPKGKYGFVRNDGTIAIMPSYDSILKEFQNGKAEVVDDKKGEIVIDKSGSYVDLTDHQKEVNAERALAKAVAEAEAQKARERAEQEALERRQRDYEMKKDCTGRTITWLEQVKYDSAGGGVGGFLFRVTGLAYTTYNIRYDAIVESILGDQSVKCIIRSVNIEDPPLASINYFKYKSEVNHEVKKNLGQTRVLDFSEFELK